MSTEFKKGEPIVFVEDDDFDGIEMPKGTRGTYDDDSPTTGAPYVLLDSGQRVPAWRPRIAHAEDHGTGDGSASDICAVPGCNCDLERRFPAPEPVVVWDGKGKIPTAAHHVHTTAGGCVKNRDGGRCTTPLDPKNVKPGDTVTLGSDGLEASVKGRVTDIQHHDHGAWTIYLTLGIMGHSTPFVVGVGTAWTLTAHQPAPAPEPVTGHGTAYVFGMVAHGIPQRRYHGFLLADGKFKFLDNDGRLTAAPPDRFDAFEPEPKPE